MGEAIYTAIVWQTIAKVVAEHRQLPDVYKVKAANVIGCGMNVDLDELQALQIPVNFCVHSDGTPVSKQLL